MRDVRIRSWQLAVGVCVVLSGLAVLATVALADGTDTGSSDPATGAPSVLSAPAVASALTDAPDDPPDPTFDGTDANGSPETTSCAPDPGEADTTSCSQDPTAPLVAAALAEPPANSNQPSPILALDSSGALASDVTQSPTGVDTGPVASAATPATGGCTLMPPLTQTPASPASGRFGLSDQSGFRGPKSTFSDPRAVALNVTRVRLIVFYDVILRAEDATSPTSQACTDYMDTYNWIANQISLGHEPLISFEHPNIAPRQAEDPSNPEALPSVGPNGRYTRAVKAFMAQFPTVVLYTAWNEPNDGAQATLHRPFRAGQYFHDLNNLCRRGRRCLVAAGDFVDESSLTHQYETNYDRGVGGVAASVWAYHPYLYLEYGQNSHAAARLTHFLSLPYVRDAAIWFTEAGAFALDGRAINKGGGSAAVLAQQNLDLATFLNSPSSVFNTDSHIKRFYYYEWHGGGGFDTGLIGAPDPTTGEATDLPGTWGDPARPVYCTYLMSTNPGATCQLTLPSGSPPVVTTGPPVNAIETSATMTGTVNPNGLLTTYHFDYGPDTSYGQSTPDQSAGSGTTALPESATIPFAGCFTAPTHFRIEATNSAGTTFGSDSTITWLCLT